MRYGVIFVLLFAGFWLLFQRIRWLELFSRLMKQTRDGVDEATRRRLLENRRKLILMQREHTIWYRLEQELRYSGWKRRCSFLTVEIWLLGNVVVLAAVFLAGLVATRDWKPAGLVVVLVAGVEYLVLWFGKLSELRSVNDNLLKFLNSFQHRHQLYQVLV